MPGIEEYSTFISKVQNMLDNFGIISTEENNLQFLLDKLAQVLEENEDFKVIFDYSVDSLFLTDGKGKILKVNAAYEKKVGVKRNEVEGKHVEDMVSEGFYSPSVVSLVLQEKRPLTMMQSSADIAKAITTSTPVFDKEGNIFRIVSNARLLEEMIMLSEYFKKIDEVKSNNSSCERKSIVFKSEVMKKLTGLLSRVAQAEAGILITGESGCGKSFFARFIHAESKRAKGNFVEINCAAIPEGLMESELFGYETGAFSGAKKGGKIGLIELANQGTLFLDEIGDMPLALQAKLLQVIQNKQITRVGGEKPIDIDVRIISATNKNLGEMVKNGSFRHDLYFRLNVIPIYVPSLREREEDIWPLAEYFIDKYCEKYQKRIVFSQKVIERLNRYDWPGNIRELENLIERLIVTDENGLIMLEHLPKNIIFRTEKEPKGVMINKILTLQEAIEQVEKQLVINAYKIYNSSYKVAGALGISQAAAFRKIKKYIK